MVYESHEQIKAIIRSAARAQGMTQERIASVMGIKQPHFSSMVNNTRMTIYQLAQIAEAIGFRLLVDFVPNETGNGDPRNQ